MLRERQVQKKNKSSCLGIDGQCYLQNDLGIGKLRCKTSPRTQRLRPELELGKTVCLCTASFSCNIFSGDSYSKSDCSWHSLRLVNLMYVVWSSWCWRQRGWLNKTQAPWNDGLIESAALISPDFSWHRVLVRTGGILATAAETMKKTAKKNPWLSQTFIFPAPGMVRIWIFSFIIKGTTTILIIGQI